MRCFGLWMVFRSCKTKLIHIESKYGEKNREVQGLSPGSLKHLEIRNEVEKY